MTDLQPADSEPAAKPINPEGARPKDEVWSSLQAEAARERESEPALGRLYASILEASSFEEALARNLARKLGHPFFPAAELKRLLLEPLEAANGIGEAARTDLSAVVERDPASSGRLLEPFLFFKGYAAIQSHRLAHWLWGGGRRPAALYLQSRASEVFQTDIHPGARFGKGVFLDHATGFVAGETVVVEDNVSVLHGVTLGGTGTDKTDRHPKIRSGVLLGAGALILGAIEIGAYSRVAAGSYVTRDVPPRCTAVGVPARIIKGAGTDNPAETMDEHLTPGTYASFNYVI
jgi:serine O-acetyltransferase